MQQSAGYFVTYLQQDNYPQQEQGSSHGSSNACPVCARTAPTIRLKRSRFQRWLTQKKHYFCRQCKTDFWISE